MSIDLEMEEIFKIFFEESFEGLDAMESRLLNLDVNADRETINSIFRAAHSIKGGAATFGFMEVSNFTHGVETLLDEMRNGTRVITPDAIQLLLQSVDGLREMLKAVQAKTPIDAQRIANLSDEIAQLLASHPGRAPAPAPAAVPAEAPVVASPPPPPAAGPATVDPSGPRWEIDFRPHADMLRTNNEPLRMFAELDQLGELTVLADTSDVPPLESLSVDACHLRWQLQLKGAVEKRDLDEVFDWVDANSAISYRHFPGPAAAAEPVAAPPAPVAAAPAPVIEPATAAPAGEPAATSPAAAGAPKAAGDAGSIRVSTTKVDHLINLVGELVITQSMLSRFADGCDPSELEKLREGLTQLTRNTRELQESVMQIRMLPISFAFNRFPRLVHDLSRKLGKKVELKLTGEGTELDKTVLEKISDPLVHLVRNALDHGLDAHLRLLEAVIERVAHEVHERVGDLLEHRLVELGALAGQLELDLLAELARQVMHEPRESVEREADRQHADLHDALLQLAGVARQLRQPLAQLLELAGVAAIGEARQHRLRDHELADQVDQVVDLGGRDADRARIARRLRRAGRRRAGRRRLARRRRRGRLDHRRRRSGDRRGRRSDRLGRSGRAREVPVADRAVRIDPVEDLVEVALLDGALQLQLPAQVAGVDGQRLERRDVARVREHCELAKLVELREHPQRLVVGAQHVGVRAKIDLPARPGRINRRRPGRRRRRRTRHDRRLGRHCGRRRRRCAAGVAREQLCDLVAQVRDPLRVDRRLRLDRLQHLAQSVDRLQQQLDRVRRDHAGAVAHLVEQRLDAVREVRDLHEAEGRGAALDRVGGAEDRVDRLAVGVDVEVQQPRLHGVETLEALFEEDLEDLFHFQVDGHQCPLQAAGLQDPGDGREQLFRVERLDDPARRTGLLALRLLFLARLGGQHQHRRVAVRGERAQLAHERDAVHPRHVHVGEHEIDAVAPRVLEGLHAVGSLYHLVAGAFQREIDHLPHGGRVVDRQDYACHLPMLRPARWTRPP